jgi:hypothetical protein
MPVTQFNVEEVFTYHPPAADQVEHYEALRAAAKTFAQQLLEHTPPGADQQAALRKLRECVMTANAAIALRGAV